MKVTEELLKEKKKTDLNFLTELFFRTETMSISKGGHLQADGL